MKQLTQSEIRKNGKVYKNVSSPETSGTMKQVTDIVEKDGTFSISTDGGKTYSPASDAVPEALPQEASALKSGNLPTSGWTKQGYKTFWEGNVSCPSSSYKLLGTSKELADILYADSTAYPIANCYGRYMSSADRNFSYIIGDVSYPAQGKGYRLSRYSSDPTIVVTQAGDIYAKGDNGSNTEQSVTYNRIGTSTVSQQFYTISDTSITANSDILMELTDDGGVKSYLMEAGKITVIRDTVPTAAIPYTYKVKQTNASGQFTLVNHYVPSIPESPTSLPVTYKKVSGELPTTGWSLLGWERSTLPASRPWISIAYGKGKFVTIANSGGKGAYSTDGINWTEMTMPSTGLWAGITYGNGKFVAVKTSSDKGAYSVDGINWTETTMPSPTYRNWLGVAYGNGKFVAFTMDSSYCAYSNDGITWTATTLPATGNWRSIVYGNDKFVAIAGSTDKGAYSTDGITWTATTLPASRNWQGITYGEGKFIAIAGSTDKGAYSTDGINWTEMIMPSSRDWFCTAYGNGKFVAIEYNGLQAAYSTDGITWLTMTTPIVRSWSGVVYGDNKFVVVSKDASVSSQNNKGLYWEVDSNKSTYTISDTSITANTSVKMYLTDKGGVKAQSKANGSITVIRDTVPTTAIPYEYEVEQTSAKGLFEVINAYVPNVPTKTSELTNDSGFVTNSAIGKGTLTIQKNGANVATFGANQSENATANISVPTKTSDLTNDSGFVTSADVPSKTSDLTNDSGFLTKNNIVAGDNVTVTDENGNVKISAMGGGSGGVTYTKLTGSVDFTTTAYTDDPYFLGQNAATWSENSAVGNKALTSTTDIGLLIGNSYTMVVNIQGTSSMFSAKAEDGNTYGLQGSKVLWFKRDDIPSQFVIYDHCPIVGDNIQAGNGCIFFADLGSDVTIADINYFSGKRGAITPVTITNSAIKINSAVTMYINSSLVVSGTKTDGNITLTASTEGSVSYEMEILNTPTEGLFEVINAYVPDVPTKTSQLTNDSGFITAADIPTAGEWVDVAGETATLTEAGTYQFVTTVDKAQSIMYWDGTTAAIGTPMVGLIVNADLPEVITITPRVDADGRLTIHQSRLVKENNAWVVKGSAISSGFKYRKIN